LYHIISYHTDHQVDKSEIRPPKSEIKRALAQIYKSKKRRKAKPKFTQFFIFSSKNYEKHREIIPKF